MSDNTQTYQVDSKHAYVAENAGQFNSNRNDSLYNRIEGYYQPIRSRYVPAPDSCYFAEQVNIPRTIPIQPLPVVEFGGYEQERAFIEANARFPQQRNIDQVPVQEIAAELCGGRMTQDLYLKCLRVYSANGENGDAAVGHLVDQLNFGLQSLRSPYNLSKDTINTSYGPRIQISLHNGPIVLGQFDIR